MRTIWPLLVAAQSLLAQDFHNLDFERARVIAIDPTFGFLDWELAVPAWKHSEGADTSVVYYKETHAAATQRYLLIDANSPVSGPGTQLAGNYSLRLTSGTSLPSPGSAWVNAFISQAGEIPAAARSIRMMAEGPLQVLVAGVEIPMQPLGGKVFAGDISLWGGSIAELKIVNAAAPGNYTALTVDDITFSPLPAPGETEPTLEQRVIIPTGLSTLANPLGRGGNTVAEVIPSVPEDTLLYLYDGCKFTINKFEFGAWVLPGLPFPPGGGALIQNAGPPFEVTFSGAAPKPAPIPPVQPGWNLISLVGAAAESLPAQEGDLLLRLVAGLPRGHRFEFGEWDPPLSMNAGEAFFYWRLPFPANCPGFQDPELYFDNRAKALGADARILGPDALPLQDPSWKVQLYAGRDYSELFPVGVPVPLRTGAAAGYVATSPESVVTIAGIAAGAPIITQIRAWDTRIGPTFEAAYATGRGYLTLPVYTAISTVLAPGLVLPGRVVEKDSGGVPLTPTLYLSIDRRETNVTVVVQLSGPSAPYVVETSSDLRQWAQVVTISNPQVLENLPISTLSRQAFYRARLEPFEE